MGVRRQWGPAAAVVAAAAGLALTPLLGWQTSVPTATGLGFGTYMVSTRSTRPAVVHAAALCTGLLSLAGTAEVLSRPPHPDPAVESWGLAETGVLMALIAAAVRWGRSPVGVLAAAVCIGAQALWILRILPDRSVSAMAVAALFWSTGSWVAVFVGGYPRFAARRERRNITAARARQRRRLERDLHDYVAHDVSGILAQAQAAQFVAQDDPGALRQLLARIEGSAHNALAAMDRTMQLLREDDGDAPTTPAAHQPDLYDLPGVVAAFASATAADVRCDFGVDPADVPPAVSAAAQRVAVEALTNVRRHAPLSSEVTVRVATSGTAGEVLLEVVNRTRTGHHQPSGRSGGTGLDRARELVTAVGGALHAGPTASGWEVSAVIPISRAGADEPKGRSR